MLPLLSGRTLIFRRMVEEKLQPTFTINIALRRQCIVQGMRKTGELFHWQDV